MEADTKIDCPVREFYIAPNILFFLSRMDLKTSLDTHCMPEQRHTTTTTYSSDTWHLLCAIQGCKSKATKGKIGILKGLEFV